MSSQLDEIVVVAGETSGDLHGSSVVREIKRLRPGTTFWGIGGDLMEKAGVTLLEHVGKMAVMGFTEIIGRYHFLQTKFREVVQVARERPPARAILIDYPGFNLALAKKFRALNIPVTYFIPPQLWAWREGRVKILKECVDQILCIFPFEEGWYSDRGVTATFVGHPLLDQGVPDVTREEFCRKHGLEADLPMVGLMPGSRQQEVNKHLPALMETVSQLMKRGYRIQSIVGRAPEVSTAGLDKWAVAVEDEIPQLALRYSDVGVVASGTASLEAALYGTPSVVVYRMSPVSWWLGRRMARVHFVSMTNLVAGKEVLPELLQRNLTGENIATVLGQWLDSPDERERLSGELKSVRKKLGSPGAARRAARLIVERLDRGGLPE
ncbi:MAG: lipid-A-disaccharide synthase [Fidelibacterota bacterium]